MTHKTSSPQDVVAGYEALLQQTQRMLEASSHQEWDTLIAYEANYVSQTERLKELDEAVLLTGARRKRKAELIEQIMVNNRRVRDRLMARRDELGELLDTSRRQRDLSRAYGVKPNQHTHLDNALTDNKSLT